MTKKNTRFVKLIGIQAIAYMEQLGGSSLLQKYADPTEIERCGVELDEARQIVKEDPSLIYCIADTTHPDHRAIMERI